MTKGTSYRLLCDALERTGGTVKLCRGQDGWGLHVIIKDAAGDTTWHAAAVLFPAISELDAQSRHLLEWLTTCRGDAATEDDAQ